MRVRERESAGDRRRERESEREDRNSSDDDDDRLRRTGARCSPLPPRHLLEDDVTGREAGDGDAEGAAQDLAALVPAGLGCPAASGPRAAAHDRHPGLVPGQALAPALPFPGRVFRDFPEAEDGFWI